MDTVDTNKKVVSYRSTILGNSGDVLLLLKRKEALANPIVLLVNVA